MCLFVHSFLIDLNNWIFGHHASGCVIDGRGSYYASHLMFRGDMGWHSAYIPLGGTPFSLGCALLQLGVPAHQWLAPF